MSLPTAYSSQLGGSTGHNTLPNMTGSAGDADLDRSNLEYRHQRRNNPVNINNNTATSSSDMSSATGINQQQQQQCIVIEDCRDYLRTGRCKYGASCKYRHPPNVQTGGGMTGPINPSEPLYPIRPDEPVCQYFMKHGTCKFGQACKFHHPPNLAGIDSANLRHHSNQQQQRHHHNHPRHQQHHHQHQQNNNNNQYTTFATTAQQVGNGGTVLVSVPIATSSTGTNARSGDFNRGNRDHHQSSNNWNDSTASSGIQILPQRPNEPNCIYWLKNGRCKYGATCRYHHPLNYHSDRSHSNSGRGNHSNGNGNRVTYTTTTQQQQDSRTTVASSAPQTHYVAQLPPGATIQQGHFVVSDGNVTFLALDGNVPAHILSLAQGGNGSGTIASSTTASSSSIASSFETAISHSNDGQDSSSSLWTTPTNNARRGNSYAEMAATGRSGNQISVGGGGGGGNGSAHGGHGNIRTVYVQNVGDAASVGLPRVLSTSSTIASDPVFYDSAVPSPSTWRGSRSASFDHTRSRASSNVQGGDDDELHKSTSVHSALDEQAAAQRSAVNRPQHYYAPAGHPGRPPPGIRSPRRQPGQDDDGLSMMTSALLTMLDTPSTEAFDENIEYESQSVTPKMGARYPAQSSSNNVRQADVGLSLNPHTESYEYARTDPRTTLRQQEQQQQFQYHHQDQRSYQPSTFATVNQPPAGDGSSLGNLSIHNSSESFPSSSTGGPGREESTGYVSSEGWLPGGGANDSNDDSQHVSSSQNVGLYLP